MVGDGVAAKLETRTTGAQSGREAGREEAGRPEEGPAIRPAIQTEVQDTTIQIGRRNKR